MISTRSAFQVKASSVPCRFRNLVTISHNPVSTNVKEIKTHLIQQRKLPHLPILIRHRIMQRMRPNISPKPIQPHLPPRRPTSSDFKNSRTNPQPFIRRHDLRTRHPLRNFSPLPLTNLPILPILPINPRHLIARPISQRFRSAQMREKIPVPL